MRNLKMSIGNLMMVTAAVAIATSLYRQFQLCGNLLLPYHRVWHEYITYLLPMACVLGFGLMVASIDLARRGRCSSFLFGFEAAGWAGLFAFLSFLVVNFENENRFSSRVTPFMMSILGLNGFNYHDTNVMLFYLSITALPQLVVALLGGWVSHALGIVLIRERGNHSEH